MNIEEIKKLCKKLKNCPACNKHLNDAEKDSFSRLYFSEYDRFSKNCFDCDFTVSTYMIRRKNSNIDYKSGFGLSLYLDSPFKLRIPGSFMTKNIEEKPKLCYYKTIFDIPQIVQIPNNAEEKLLNKILYSSNKEFEQLLKMAAKDRLFFDDNLMCRK
jgi:hypothetical protein